MDVIELLTEDHERVLALFEQFDNLKEQPGQNINKLEKFFAKLKTELDLHTSAEEQFFYPELQDEEDTHDLVVNAFKEHQTIKTVLAELESEQIDDKWTAKMSELKETVMHHIGEEENDLFERAVEILDENELNAIGDSIVQLKKAA